MDSHFFKNIQLQFFSSLCLREGETFSPLKKTSSTSKHENNWLFLFLWVIFPLTGSASSRPKSMRIRIHNTGLNISSSSLHILSIVCALLLRNLLCANMPRAARNTSARHSVSSFIILILLSEIEFVFRNDKNTSSDVGRFIEIALNLVRRTSYV